MQKVDKGMRPRGLSERLGLRGQARNQWKWSLRPSLSVKQVRISWQVRTLVMHVFVLSLVLLVWPTVIEWYPFLAGNKSWTWATFPVLIALVWPFTVTLGTLKNKDRSYKYVRAVKNKREWLKQHVLPFGAAAGWQILGSVALIGVVTFMCLFAELGNGWLNWVTGLSRNGAFILSVAVLIIVFLTVSTFATLLRKERRAYTTLNEKHTTSKKREEELARSVDHFRSQLAEEQREHSVTTLAVGALETELKLARADLATVDQLAGCNLAIAIHLLNLSKKRRGMIEVERATELLERSFGLMTPDEDRRRVFRQIALELIGETLYKKELEEPKEGASA